MSRFYALCPESFRGENLAIRKVFAFSDSAAKLLSCSCIICVFLFTNRHQMAITTLNALARSLSDETKKDDIEQQVD